MLVGSGLGEQVTLVPGYADDDDAGRKRYRTMEIKLPLLFRLRRAA